MSAPPTPGTPFLTKRSGALGITTLGEREPSIAGTSPKPCRPQLGFVGFAEALELTLLLSDKEPAKYDRAAARWHTRFVQETPNVGVRQSQAVLALLVAIPSERGGRRSTR